MKSRICRYVTSAAKQIWRTINIIYIHLNNMLSSVSVCLFWFFDSYLVFAWCPAVRVEVRTTNIIWLVHEVLRLVNVVGCLSWLALSFASKNKNEKKNRSEILAKEVFFTSKATHSVCTCPWNWTFYKGFSIILYICCSSERHWRRMVMHRCFSMSIHHCHPVCLCSQLCSRASYAPAHSVCLSVFVAPI